MSKPKAAPGTTREEVREALERGRTPREIALVLGLSTQAVYWHIKRLGDERTEQSA